MDKAEQLKQVELFSQLDEKYLEVLAPSCHEKSFASGERLVEQGEEGIGLMIITSGKVRVVKKTAAGDEIEVATPVEAGRSIELPLDMRNSGRLRIELEYSDLLGTRYLQRTCHVRLPDGTYYCRQYEEKNPGRLEGELISNYRERIRVTRS